MTLTLPLLLLLSGVITCFDGMTCSLMQQCIWLAIYWGSRHQTCHPSYNSYIASSALLTHRIPSSPTEFPRLVSQNGRQICSKGPLGCHASNERSFVVGVSNLLVGASNCNLSSSCFITFLFFMFSESLSSLICKFPPISGHALNPSSSLNPLKYLTYPLLCVSWLTAICILLLLLLTLFAEKLRSWTTCSPLYSVFCLYHCFL